MDNLFEDEAERIKLQAKPTCFIVVGKPVITLSLFFYVTAQCILQWCRNIFRGWG